VQDFVISTKAEGRAERVPKRELTRLGSQESGWEWTMRHMRGQMSRLRFASLDMTSAGRAAAASTGLMTD
jgi:hypothetical protein